MKSHIYKWDQLQAILHNTNVAFFFLLFKWVNSSLGFIKWLTLGTYNYLLSTYYAPGILTATVCLSEMWVQWRHDPRSSKTWLYFSRMCQSRGRQNVLALELATQVRYQRRVMRWERGKLLPSEGGEGDSGELVKEGTHYTPLVKPLGGVSGWGCPSFMCQHRKNSVRGKAIDKKWFIRIEHLWGLQAGRREGAVPWELHGLPVYNHRERGEEEKTTFSFLNRLRVSVLSSSSRLGRRVFLHSQARTVKNISSLCTISNAINYYFFHMRREYVLGIINFLSALARMCVSCHHCFLVWGHVVCFCCMVLWLSKHAFLSNH